MSQSNLANGLLASHLFFQSSGFTLHIFLPHVVVNALICTGHLEGISAQCTHLQVRHNGLAHVRLKSAPFDGGSGPRSKRSFLWPARVFCLKAASGLIRLFFAQFTYVPDTHTDRSWCDTCSSVLHLCTACRQCSPKVGNVTCPAPSLGVTCHEYFEIAGKCRKYWVG